MLIKNTAHEIPQPPYFLRRTVALLVASCLLMGNTSLAFTTAPQHSRQRVAEAAGVHGGRPQTSRANSGIYIGDGISDGDNNQSAMSSNRLSHAMLRVADVNTTVGYWVGRGATVSMYRKSGTGETAFVTFGNGQDSDENNGSSASSSKCFSLEITALPPGEESRPGNAIRYLGLSMLLDFKNNLLGAAAGGKPRKRTEEENHDPNRLEVRPVASGPGDYFCRLCLRPASSAAGSDGDEEEGAVNGRAGDPLEMTVDFYTKVLGMRAVANDDSLVCLRYKNEGGFGVPTSLVFSREGEDEELDHGNCLDHIVISTKNVDDAAAALKDLLGADAFFMEPQTMFGAKIMGIKDPNGYKLYLAEMDSEES